MDENLQPIVSAAPAAPAPLSERNPSYEEALAMFEDNPGLAWVLSDQGNLSREGTLVPMAQGE